MTNVEKYIQMKNKAADAFFEEDEEEKGRNLNHQASLFAEANFTEADFDEYISTCYGYEKFIMTQWKNEVLKERAAKANSINDVKKQLGF